MSWRRRIDWPAWRAYARAHTRPALRYFPIALALAGVAVLVARPDPRVAQAFVFIPLLMLADALARLAAGLFLDWRYERKWRALPEQKRAQLLAEQLRDVLEDAAPNPAYVREALP